MARSKPSLSWFNLLSPLDYRYWDLEVAEYLSENGFLKYKLKVEVALVKSLAKLRICPASVAEEVESAAGKITSEEVYEEESKVKHDIRALVNCLRSKVSKKSRPYIHLLATSADIADSANAARFRDITQKVVLPALKDLEKTLIAITVREANTLQIARTHGQHAVPITFGFALGRYVERIGNSIQAIEKSAEGLRGKFSGAVGAHNAAALLVNNPEILEKAVLDELGLKPDRHASQIVSPEPLARLLIELVLAGGALANLADDMRHLQRTEIGEVGEEFIDSQVGSSTMPQKRNPISFENIKSLWKVAAPRLLTVLMDQISEHQRDLTNSASSRTYPEIVAYLVFMAKRLTGAMEKLKVDKESMERNLASKGDLILGEAFYVILASLGYPDAHEKIRLLALQSNSERRSLGITAESDQELVPYLKNLTKKQRALLDNPALYTGLASQKARTTAERWKRKLKL